jgi:phosphotransferase system enzyme I (PtsI)
MPDSSSSRNEIKLTGVAAAPGVAHGDAFVFLQDKLDIPCYPVSKENFPREVARFEEAMAATRVQISRLRSEVAERLGENEAAIFDAHLLVLEDPALIEETMKTLEKTGQNIEHCFHLVTQRYMDFFSKMEDDYLKERVADIRDVSVRLLHNLLGLGRRTLAEITEQRVVISEDLTPSDTATLESGHVLAIATDGGNRTSHAVIMARSMRVPAVVGLRNATGSIHHGDSVLVDGFEGVVYVNPSSETLARYGKLKHERKSFEDAVMAEVGMPDVTNDGVGFLLSSNVGGPEDVDDVKRFHGRGVGLFRSESIFLKGDCFPDEDTQYEAYKKVVAELAPAQVIIRTLDIGGDKQMPSANTHGEENPFMGFRAIRFCLEHRDIFKVQLRAILRASAHGKAAIMFPMIASLAELQQARGVLFEVMDDLRHHRIPFDTNIRMGVMIEIPSAALMADSLANNCDFFSIGTNDLVQYLLAVDRGNERIAHLYDPCQPVISRVIRDVVAAAKRRGIPVGVCGEMAGDPIYAPMLLGLGVDSLSMTSACLPELRFLLRRTGAAELKALADAVLAEDDPRVIENRLRDFCAKRIGPLMQS